MCGIIGYVGKQQAAPILLDALRRLEYRGYDSAGVAIVCDGELKVRKRTGKINEGLGPLLDREPLPGVIGLGHTRWATHGAPTDENAHPHWDHSGRIAVVHNGIIENYDRLKQKLKGHTFKSSTDTEVLAHLIGQHYEELKAKHDGRSNGQPSPTDCGQLLTQAVISALKEVVGAYGIGVVCLDCPGVMVGARRGSPLIVGVGQGEHFLASDASALAAYTREVVYLNDYDVVTVMSDRFNLAHSVTGKGNYEVTSLEFGAEAAERGAFAHYMLKEIFEQPRSVENALRGRVDHESATAKFGGLNLSTAELRAVNQIVITACGTSWHAGLIGEYLLEELAHVPVEVEYASEFRYRNAPLENNTLVLAITQSGETADTLASLRETKRRGHKVLGICNVVGSTIAREADGGIYLHAGPEIGVASTKAFTSQVTVMALLAVFMGRMRMLSLRRGQEILSALEAIPKQMEQVLAHNDHIRKIADKYKSAEDFFFLGRQYNFPVALEGALKLKEISYIHAEGYPAAEMKHGPIALIDQKTPSVVIIPSDSMYEKTLSNLQVVKARKGPIIAVATEGDRSITKEADDVIY
ncbi:MAG TPA: glutamine--fructose-6-phosphate transaminase (isomerizing), partial [Candidatus Binatia bacterium]|nr:glutamine--fructose-6-phosphate transaminase (isomerizing) [Candidatus Binatia bacterium]